MQLNKGKLPSHTEGFLFAVQEQRINTKALKRQRESPGSVLEKKLTGGSAYFFGSEIFYILIFWGLENLSYFLGLKIFHLFFGGDNFDTNDFFGCPDKRSWFAKPLKK